ncbi:arfaptin-2 isoform X2 [Mauremys mutica]|uniref:arfaptin-2 isoform X2 n=1 Tax=Mauremys mutica TaxID=74926 RepID=UPI001D13B6A3|nr:arfaptin-2 isoform X2 [Mauremys mutica]
MLLPLGESGTSCSTQPQPPSQNKGESLNLTGSKGNASKHRARGPVELTASRCQGPGAEQEPGRSQWKMSPSHTSGKGPTGEIFGNGGVQANSQIPIMTDGLMSKAATMEIPINGTGDTGSLPEDDSLEQDLQQVMVSGPNLNETSIVSGGYGGTAEGIIPTSSGLHLPHPGPLATGDEAARGIAVEKFDIVKKWGINTYKCTKQLISERFGRGSRTVDLELETQIELLRDTKRKYECVLQLARALTHHFYSLVQTQHALGDAFSDLSQKSPELQEEFGCNAETQKLLCKNGETLLGAVNFFVSSINTLVNKTMEDTLMTVKQYETARLEYDAYRTDLEELSMGPRDASTLCRLDAAQSHFQSHKGKYEKLRADVAIKLKFLEENKIQVMHQQQLLFHNAVSAYFAGNQQQLAQTLRQFNIKLKTPGAEKPSWLEEQ